jgi:glycogen debranching enzyme
MPLIINRDTTFLISDELGDVPDGAEFGLYVEDIRVIRRYALTVEGQSPLLLTARATDPASAIHFLTNPALPEIARGALSIVRRRHVGEGLVEELEVVNYGRDTAVLSLGLEFEPDATHIIAVRQSLKQADLCPPTASVVPTPQEGGRLLRFDGAEFKSGWELLVGFCRPPDLTGDRCRFQLRLAPKESWHLCIQSMTAEMAACRDAARPCRRRSGADSAVARTRRVALIDQAPAVDTDLPVVRQAYEQSVRDIAALRMKGEASADGEAVIAAGIPWFMALFGRDSLIAAYQVLPFYPELAKGVLRALARLQGSRVNPPTLEEPGKILHEHRPGTVDGAQTLIPDFPYYGSVDATPLFLMLLAATYRLTGDRAFVESLRENAVRALEWMDRYGDRDGDGYLEYTPEDGTGLANHGWKDSFDSVQFSDGTLARPPIALCEVQGYAYAARLGMAEVFDGLGEPQRAAQLREDAAAFRNRFERDFWLPEQCYYALALDGDKRPVDAITSNPGHLLWTGIVSPERARLVARRLVSPELFSGWGVRTMATDQRGYNPLSYHNGSVWPHDTGLIIAGLARYGFETEAAALCDGLLAALDHAPDHRLPEVFAGYDRADAPFPVDHPMSSCPQAWAAGTVFLLLSAMVGFDLSVPGLQGTAFLPPSVSHLSVSGIWEGGRQVAIHATRAPAQAHPRSFQLDEHRAAGFGGRDARRARGADLATG